MLLAHSLRLFVGFLVFCEALQLEVGFWDVYMPIDGGGLDAVPGF